jgi:hypothetical protein
MRRAYSGQTTGHDLAALGDKLREQAYVLVVDGFDLLGAEPPGPPGPPSRPPGPERGGRRSPDGASLAAGAGFVSSAMLLLKNSILGC